MLALKGKPNLPTTFLSLMHMHLSPPAVPSSPRCLGHSYIQKSFGLADVQGLRASPIVSKCPWQEIPLSAHSPQPSGDPLTYIHSCKYREQVLGSKLGQQGRKHLNTIYPTSLIYRFPEPGAGILHVAA